MKNSNSNVQPASESLPIGNNVLAEGVFFAYCWQIHHSVCFSIPFRNGKGYLKSCVGFHNLNKFGRKLSDEIYNKDYIDFSSGEFCDLDGYLQISIKSKYCYDDKIDFIIEDLKNVIQKVFPHVVGFI